MPRHLPTLLLFVSAHQNVCRHSRLRVSGEEVEKRVCRVVSPTRTRPLAPQKNQGVVAEKQRKVFYLLEPSRYSRGQQQSRAVFEAFGIETEDFFRLQDTAGSRNDLNSCFGYPLAQMERPAKLVHKVSETRHLKYP